MRPRSVVLLASALLLVFATSQASGDLISTFDSSSEGWTGMDPVGHDWNGSWHSTGGNPGGYMDGLEANPNGGTGYFIAPASWSGNWTQYIGGSLTYDEKVFSGTRNNYFFDRDVIIYGTGSSYVSWTSPTSLWSSDWATHGVALTAANFTGGNASFASVMSDVTGLWVRGEFIVGPEEEGLDNVRLAAAPTPEPSTLILLSLGGLAVAIGFSRRRRAG